MGEGYPQNSEKQTNTESSKTHKHGAKWLQRENKWPSTLAKLFLINYEVIGKICSPFWFFCICPSVFSILRINVITSHLYRICSSRPMKFIYKKLKYGPGRVAQLIRVLSYTPKRLRVQFQVKAHTSLSLSSSLSPHFSLSLPPSEISLKNQYTMVRIKKEN